METRHHQPIPSSRATQSLSQFRWGNSQVLQGGVLLQSLGAATEQGPDPTKWASDMTTENGDTHIIDKHGVILKWKMITNIDWPIKFWAALFSDKPVSQEFSRSFLSLFDHQVTLVRAVVPMSPRSWANVFEARLAKSHHQSRMERAWKNIAWHQIEQKKLNLVSAHSLIKSGFLI